MKIVTIKGLWLLHWRTKFDIDISNHLWVIEVWNVENRTHTHTRITAHTHTHTHTHTSWRQLKIKFVGVLDYSEYSDTNMSKKNFRENIASSVRKQKSIIWGLGSKSTWITRVIFFAKMNNGIQNRFLLLLLPHWGSCFREKKIRDISVRELRMV